MSQNSPQWIPLLIGGSGLLGLVTWVTKGIVDKKEAHIQTLKERILQLNEKISEEERKRQLQFDNFAKQLKSIDSGQLGSAEALQLREILNLAEGLAGLREGFSDCRQAAEWVHICRNDWVRRASKEATTNYRNLMPREKLPLFKEDLEQYVNWLSACLNKGGKTNVPLSEYVDAPAISYSHPYVAAITFLKDSNSYGNLSKEQAGYLKIAFDRLIEKLRKQFADA